MGCPYQNVIQLDCKHSVTVLAVCFGSLSCWNFQTRVMFSSAYGHSTKFKIVLYTTSVSVLFMTLINSIPWPEKQPHTNILPPLKLTVLFLYFEFSLFPFGCLKISSKLYFNLYDFFQISVVFFFTGR